MERNQEAATWAGHLEAEGHFRASAKRWTQMPLGEGTGGPWGGAEAPGTAGACTQPSRTL